MTSPSEPAVAESPEHTVDLVDARRYCEHAMKKIRSIAAARAVIEDSAQEQMDEIRAWHEQETTRLDGETERLRVGMRPLVSALVEADPLGKRSVEFVAGRAGFREGRERVVKEDEAAAIAWLGENFEGCLRYKTEIDLNALKSSPAFRVSGERFKGVGDSEIIPGLRVEKAAVTYYTEPVGKAGPAATPTQPTGGEE